MSHDRPWAAHRWLALAARVYLGAIFLLACTHKIARPDLFAVDVATYQLLPLSAVNLFAITLPWVELVAALLLLVGWRVRAAALLVGVMMAAFTVALAWALHRGLDMSCGCFASQSAAHDDPISWKTVVRDVAWLALAVYVVAVDHAPLGVDHWLSRHHRRTDVPA